MIDFSSDSANDFTTGLIPSVNNTNPLIATSNSPVAIAPVPVSAALSQPKAALAAVAPVKDPLTGKGIGLMAEYYDDITFTNLKKTDLDATIDFDWGKAAPQAGMGVDTFSVRWTGQIQPKYSEEYAFKTTSDDGVRLWIDGKLVIDHWKDQPALPHSGKISLEAGKKYDIRLEYYDNLGAASQKLAWASTSQSLETVPTSQLYPQYASNASIPSAVEQAYSIKPETIGLRVNSGGVMHRQQILYQAQPFDSTSAGGYVTREGKLLGRLLADGKTLTTFEKVIGPKLDLTWSDNAANYLVTSTDDPNFA
jgi:PA14 domain